MCNRLMTPICIPPTTTKVTPSIPTRLPTLNQILPQVHVCKSCMSTCMSSSYRSRYFYSVSPHYCSARYVPRRHQWYTRPLRWSPWYKPRWWALISFKLRFVRWKVVFWVILSPSIPPIALVLQQLLQPTPNVQVITTCTLYIVTTYELHLCTYHANANFGTSFPPTKKGLPPPPPQKKRRPICHNTRTTLPYNLVISIYNI